MMIEVIGSLEGLETLRPQWAELYRRCPRATPFQSPQWLLPWMRHLFQGGDIVTLAMRDDHELIGLAPLFCWGIGHRTVSFLGAGVSDYGDLLFVPGRERECAAAAWDFLTTHYDHWDLQEVRSGSALLEGQRAEECSVCPVLAFNTYPETMDRKQRTDLRRAQNKVAHCSECAFTSNIDDFFRLHEARWGALEPCIRRFHTEAAARFHASKNLRLALLRIEGTPAAAIYAFAAGQTLYCYLSGFDPACAKLSPGAVLLAWLIEQAMREGLTEIDFLRQPEAYKYLWGARDRVNYKLIQSSGAID
jgi:CelD/BcsL family acetyltransferase involved in cellulose biosynthesis